VKECFRQRRDVFIDDFSHARWARDVRARAKIFLQHEHVFVFRTENERECVCERLLLCAFFMTLASLFVARETTLKNSKLSRF